ncbi:organic cation transporter protein-like [Pocillopora damicornis]|uniref:organic cation transporter protein-like n=1 Tax=Pocillopora damicornis TaxID=46731 RepID=UPI000F559087|nr:organic cation transporter protein-like [Pocillopora damicornis]
MAGPSPVDSFYATFPRLKSVLYRSTSILAFILFFLTYQMAILEFLIDEQEKGVCISAKNCLVYTSVDVQPLNNSSLPTNSTETSTDPVEKVILILVTTHTVCMLLGTLILGLAADASGRLKTLLASVFVIFIAGIASSLAFHFLWIFIFLRGVIGFAAAGAIQITLILVAEYVSSTHRPTLLSLFWITTTLAYMSAAGLAYALQNIQMFILGMTLPLLLTVLLWKFAPESPRWFLLNSSSDEEINEAHVLLERAVDERQRKTSKFRDCLSMWRKFYTPPNVESNNRCFAFLRRKDPRRKTIVLAFAWFSLGILYRGLNISSIQLLPNFYANYAVREIVHLLGVALFFFMVTRIGRRACTVLSMMFAGVFCLLFSLASREFLKAERHAVTLVIQLTGRVCMMASQASLNLYSIELFPTVGRCSAVCLVFSFAYLGEALAPLIMKLQLQTQAVVPLGVMGLLSLTTGFLCQFFLPKTKGREIETFEDSTEIDGLKERSPKFYRRRTTNRRSQQVEMTESTENTVNDARCDEDAKLRQSWEVSFDRVSQTSHWEMLSYEDAKRKTLSISTDQSFAEESHILSEEDIDKLALNLQSTTWILAYSTFQHGMSLNTLYHRVREVETPVLLVVEDSNGFVFGVFSPVAPRIGPDKFFGVGKSFFFTCKPKYEIYPCSGKNNYYMTGDNTNLAFGCSEGKFGLWLDSELYHGRSTACDTYNSEMLSATEDFICIGVEVWAFG